LKSGPKGGKERLGEDKWMKRRSSLISKKSKMSGFSGWGKQNKKKALPNAIIAHTLF